MLNDYMLIVFQKRYKPLSSIYRMNNNYQNEKMSDNIVKSRQWYSDNKRDNTQKHQDKT